MGAQNHIHLGRLAVLSLFICLGATVGHAQTTAFTYQGRLTDGSNPANGNYDLQFALFDSSTGPTQIGSPLTRSAVTVSSGVFSVPLDFGVNAFPGADRFLEIGVRLAGGSAFTTLSPRQQISSTPYAIRTLIATTADGLSSSCTACVQDAQISSVAGNKVTGTIPVASVPVGSASYIQNTGSQQSSANFNISGNGTLGGNLLTSGRVGVGTTSPISKFHIVLGASEVFPPRLESSGTNTFAAGLDFYHGSTGKGYVGVPDPSAGFAAGELLLFGGSGTKTSLWAGSNRAVTIDTSGDVSIGTTTTFGKLDVEGGSNVGVYARSDSNFGMAAISNSNVALIVMGFGHDLVEGFDGASPEFRITDHGTYIGGSDFAEALPACGDRARYEPGDVLVVSTKAPGKVEKASRPYDTRVAGIYSTRPGMLGADKNGASRVDADEVPVAIVGIVPTKVSARNGSIRVGDLLTTSSTPGYAMRCANRARCVGAVVGKAMEPLTSGKRVIKMLVMLR